MVYFQQLEKIGVQKERIIYEVQRFMDSVSSSREASQQATAVAVIQSDWSTCTGDSLPWCFLLLGCSSLQATPDQPGSSIILISRF
jgi:hypothetical protein